MWGREVVKAYHDRVEFVGLSDKNEGRLRLGKAYLEVNCPLYLDFEEMLRESTPDVVIVTTMDSTHHEFIIKSLNAGMHVITEKPMTTDDVKVEAILEAERKSGKQVLVTFNYRYSPHRQKLYELLQEGAIGKVTSVDFHWYLDTSHGADYFRRWHGIQANSGSLLVHKSSHHFDLLNWWLNSDPEEVFAYGSLEFYGKNGPFRSKTCRGCPHASSCDFYWDITKNKHLYQLYVENEKYDGYHRDGCVFREEIDSYDKMAVQIRYKNQVQVSYSLTTYSPYEGYRIAFNGTEGRLEAWIKEKQPWEEKEEDEEEDDDDSTTKSRRQSKEDDDDEDDLVNEDDVEADLDTILKDRMVTVEEDDEDEEDTPLVVDSNAEAVDGVQPKRSDEKVCPSCFLLVRSGAPTCPVGDDDCPIISG